MSSSIHEGVTTFRVRTAPGQQAAGFALLQRTLPALQALQAAPLRGQPAAGPASDQPGPLGGDRPLPLMNRPSLPAGVRSPLVEALAQTAARGPRATASADGR